MMRRKRALLVGIAWCLMMASGTAWAVSFIVGDAQPVGDEAVVVPIEFSAADGGQGSALQFDLRYDASRFSVADVAVGSAAQAAGKGASSNVVEPGVLRVIVAGMNQDIVGSGTIAEVTFNVVDPDSSGTSNLVFRNTVVSDPYGSGVPSNGVDGRITLGTDTTDEPAGDDTEQERESTEPEDATASQSRTLDSDEPVLVPPVVALPPGVQAAAETAQRNAGRGLPSRAERASADREPGRLRIGRLEREREAQASKTGAAATPGTGEESGRKPATGSTTQEVGKDGGRVPSPAPSALVRSPDGTVQQQAPAAELAAREQGAAPEASSSNSRLVTIAVAVAAAVVLLFVARKFLNI